MERFWIVKKAPIDKCCRGDHNTVYLNLKKMAEDIRKDSGGEVCGTCIYYGNVCVRPQEVADDYRPEICHSNAVACRFHKENEDG